MNVVGGWSFSENKNKRDGYSVVGFNDDLHMNPAFSTGFTDGQKPNYSLERSRSTSFFMNVNYSFMNRYLMDFNVRSDGTSKFGRINVSRQLGLWVWLGIFITRSL